jgi:hypothetical protein
VVGIVVADITIVSGSDRGFEAPALKILLATGESLGLSLLQCGLCAGPKYQ